MAFLYQFRVVYFAGGAKNLIYKEEKAKIKEKRWENGERRNFHSFS